MKYYAARIGNMWLGRYEWSNRFGRDCLRNSLGQLKSAVTRHSRGKIKDPFDLAMTAAGGQIVVFELKESAEEIIPLTVTTDGEKDMYGNYSFSVVYEGKKEKKGKK